MNNKDEIISKVERWAKDIKLRSMKISLHRTESFKPEIREREGLMEDGKLVIKKICAEPDEREKIEKAIELAYFQALKEFEKMIDECNTYIPLVKSEFSKEGMDEVEAIMEEDRDGEWIRAKELKSKINSQQEKHESENRKY